MSTLTLTSEYAAIVDRLAELTAQSAELSAEAEDLKASLRKLGEGDFTLPDPAGAQPGRYRACAGHRDVVTTAWLSRTM